MTDATDRIREVMRSRDAEAEGSAPAPSGRKNVRGSSVNYMPRNRVKECKTCGEDFELKAGNQRYCAKCREARQGPRPSNPETGQDTDMELRTTAEQVDAAEPGQSDAIVSGGLGRQAQRIRESMTSEERTDAEQRDLEYEWLAPDNSDDDPDAPPHPVAQRLARAVNRASSAGADWTPMIRQSIMAPSTQLDDFRAVYFDLLCELAGPGHELLSTVRQDLLDRIERVLHQIAG